MKILHRNIGQIPKDGGPKMFSLFTSFCRSLLSTLSATLSHLWKSQLSRKTHLFLYNRYQKNVLISKKKRKKRRHDFTSYFGFSPSFFLFVVSQNIAFILISNTIRFLWKWNAVMDAHKATLAQGFSIRKIFNEGTQTTPINFGWK